MYKHYSSLSKVLFFLDKAERNLKVHPEIIANFKLVISELMKF